MHFVAALDGEPRLRAVLTLFEGVATGAADGYARMAGKPAATLLHLGCGLGNGLANLHNARKGKVPIVNIVGDHATYHVLRRATAVRHRDRGAQRLAWLRAHLGQHRPARPGRGRRHRRRAGLPGQVATLILPADVSWSEGGCPARPAAVAPKPADEATVQAIAGILRSGQKAALLLGGHALREPALVAAARLAAATGVKLLAEVFPTRLERGAGLPPVERLAYFAELAGVQLAGLKHLVLVDAKSPVSFFAYPGKASDLVPPGCTVHTLAAPDQDAGQPGATGGRAGRGLGPAGAAGRRPARAPGELSAAKACKAVGHLLPEGAILVDEAITSGLMLGAMTAGAPRHDLLTLTGGAIGQGLPSALGAAVACPAAGDRAGGRRLGHVHRAGAVDHGARAAARDRHHLQQRVVLGAQHRAGRVGAGEPGPRSRAQLDLGAPQLDFARLAQGMGVHAVRADTAEAFCTALEYALATPGPHLIEALVPESIGGAKRKVLPWVLGAAPHLPQPVAQALKRAIAP
jgi:acetolactate synthase-1/2/3 large subunit